MNSRQTYIFVTNTRACFYHYILSLSRITNQIYISSKNSLAKFVLVSIEE